MLEEVNIKELDAKGMRFGIIASKFNATYVDSMAEAALQVLRKAGADETEMFRVPGAYEIPAVVGHLLRKANERFSALICLGVVLRGETTHAQHITESVCMALAQAQMQYDVPVINGVYLFENKLQSDKRCMDPVHNRGIELANTAIEMGRLLLRLKTEI